MKNWGDAKRWLFEDMVVYGGILLFDILWDFIINMLAAAHIPVATHEPDGHPYFFGLFQMVVLIFCSIQLIRKRMAWRYYE